jgi:transposase
MPAFYSRSSLAAMDASDALLWSGRGCLMAKTNRDFAPEFKRRAVALLEGSGWLLMEAAQLKISPSAPRKRRTVVHGGTAPSRASSKVTLVSSALMASPADQAAEIARPRREPDRTRMERNVSKKSRRHPRGGA